MNIVHEDGDETEDIVLQNLSSAWKCILDQYFDKAEAASREEGPGINIFCMLPKPKNNIFNCSYYYAQHDRQIWNYLVSLAPNTQAIKRIYDSKSMFAICIQVPVDELDSSSIANIRLFKFISREEVSLPKRDFVEQSEK